MSEDNLVSDFRSHNPNADDLVSSGQTVRDAKMTVSERLPLIEDFSLLKRLNAEGSTCEAYKLEYRSRVYFVKRLKPEFVNRRQYLMAFEKEYELGSRLSHPSLPRYVDFFRTAKDCYIVMEYVDGKTLRELWHNPLTANREVTFNILNQLVDVLEYLHRNNVIHCDLLPQNVMLTNGFNNAVLIDLDKAYSHAYANSAGDASRFVEEEDRCGSTDADFRALAMLVKKGFWGEYDENELKHFCDLCMTPGVTHDELRSALAHKYDNLTIEDEPFISGRNCDCYEGEWNLRPVFVKKLKAKYADNDYYLRKMHEEYVWLYDVSGRPLTMPQSLLFRQTGDTCCIVIEKFSGLPLSKMIADHNPWLQNPANIKFLMEEFLDLHSYLWEEGNDYVDYDTDDIFIDPSLQGIVFANLGDIIDVRVSRVRLNREILRLRDAETGEISVQKTYTTPLNLDREYPMVCRLVAKLRAGGVDVRWLEKMSEACRFGASLIEIHSRFVKGWKSL